MKMMKQSMILFVFVLVLPHFVQAMTADQKRQAKMVEQIIKGAFRRFDKGNKSFAELEKIVVDKISTLKGLRATGLAAQYEQMLKKRWQQQQQLLLGPQEQQQQQQQQERFRQQQQQQQQQQERVKQQQQLYDDVKMAEDKVKKLTFLLKTQYRELLNLYTDKGYTNLLVGKIRDITESIDDTYLFTQQELDMANNVFKTKLFKVALRLKKAMTLYANRINKALLKKAMYTKIIGFITKYNNLVPGNTLDVSDIPVIYFKGPTKEDVKEQRKRDEEQRKRDEALSREYEEL